MRARERPAKARRLQLRLGRLRGPQPAEGGSAPGHAPPVLSHRRRRLPLDHRRLRVRDRSLGRRWRAATSTATRRGHAAPRPPATSRAARSHGRHAACTARLVRRGQPRQRVRGARSPGRCTASAAASAGRPQLREAELRSARVPRAPSGPCRRAVAVWGGASIPVMMRSPGWSSSPASARRARDRLDHRLEVRGRALGAQGVLLLAIGGMRPAPGSRVSTRGPKATARWKMLPGEDLLHAEVEIGRVGELEGGQEGRDRAAVGPSSTATSLSTTTGRSSHSEPSSRSPSLVRNPASGRVDAELLLDLRDVEADLPADRLRALGQDLPAAHEQGGGAALHAHGVITIFRASRRS